MFNAVVTYCQSLSENAIVSSQTPALLDFLTTYTYRKQIMETSTPLADDGLPPFEETPEPLATDFKGHLVILHLLTRALFYRAAIPASILRHILESCGSAWTRENYTRIVSEFRSFSNAADVALISAFEDHCRESHASPLCLSLKDFQLPEDFTMRSVALSEIPAEALIWRVACAQLWNASLKACLHVIDLGGSDHRFKTLGSLVTQLSFWVFEEVKTDALEIAIRQTEYCGVDSYPVVEIDNRKIFSEIEREDFSVTERSALESDCVFGQLFRAMRSVRTDVLRCKLDGRDRLIAIKMKGEQGLDLGVLYRETMERW